MHRNVNRHADKVFAVVGDRSSAARSVVAASWIRSLKRYGLDPEQNRPPQRLSAAELAAARDRREPLLQAARSSLDHLFLAVGAAGCCVMLTDDAGVPLERRCTAPDDEGFRRLGLWTGMVWNEACEGTNGVGTCLAEDRPLTIHHDQHFYTRNIGLSCSVAPIHDHEGGLVGALDVSSCRTDLDDRMVGLIAGAVSDAARGIEARHFRNAFPKARIVLCPDADRDISALLAIDRDDLVIGATRSARSLYGLGNGHFAHPQPAERLFAAETDTNENLVTAERSALQRALARAGGNVSGAARALGVSRATLHRKMNRLGLRLSS